MSYGFHTRSVHAGNANDALTGAVVPPIYQTSTYGQAEIGGDPAFCYSRTGNPSREALEESLASLEDARYALAFASGMAAINNVLNTLSAGDHVVACNDLYGGAYRIFTKLYAKLGIDFSFVDATQPENVASAIQSRTRVLWLETPSNPLLRITDIEACAAIAHAAGVTCVVDNTFATPYLQSPLALGADVVLHSTTKYLNGHSDTLGGALVTNDEDLHERLRFFQNTVGAVPGVQDCFLIQRGIKTLALRVERHCATARRIAEFLVDQRGIARVFYPGLPDHPHHAVAAKQQRDFGGVVSFELAGGLEAVKRFAGDTGLWTLAESLGGVKSLWCHPPTMTHAAVEPDVRRRHGLNDGLIRLSPGLEDAEDLVASLAAALDRAAASETLVASRKTVPV